MENINKKNYNTAGKTGFENSPAKVWHVNELIANNTPAPTTPAFKEVFLTTGYLNNAQVVYNTFTATGFPTSNPSTGLWTFTFNNVADRPTANNKIEVIADVVGGFDDIALEIWRISVYSTAHINGVVNFRLYKYNTTTNEWALAQPPITSHPVHIRVYN